MGQDLSLSAVIAAILTSEESWKVFCFFALTVMTKKEKAERERKGEGRYRPRLSQRGRGRSRADARPAYRGAGALDGEKFSPSPSRALRRRGRGERRFLLNGRGRRRGKRRFWTSFDTSSAKHGSEREIAQRQASRQAAASSYSPTQLKFRMATARALRARVTAIQRRISHRGGMSSPPDNPWEIVSLPN